MPSALPQLDPIDTGDGYQLDIDYFLKHEFADIGEAMETIPAIIEYVNSRLQLMIEQKIRKKQHIKHVEAKTYMSLKTGGFEDRFAGKATETALERAVQLDDDVVKAYDDYAILVGWSTRLTNTLISLQLKLDMVRSTEATRRELSKGEEENDD